ncbi:MAG: hypothetical protein HN816_04555, partial [Gammaproteobacteria bacterium]|nr:hypothetical protein [Gammaproteobacteria bacterium]
VAILWSPVIAGFDSIYGAIVSLISYVAPPITAVFLVGIFWKRATPKAAAITLWSGFVMGMIVFAIDRFKDYTGWSMGSLHAAGLLCGICILIIIVVSLLDEDTNTEENLKLVWDSPMTPLRIKGSSGLMNYKVLSIIVMLAASIIYFMFRAPSPANVEAWKTANPKAAALIENHINPPAPADEE